MTATAGCPACGGDVRNAPGYAGVSADGLTMWSVVECKQCGRWWGRDPGDMSRIVEAFDVYETE